MNDTRGTKGSLRLALAALMAACILALCAVLPQNAWAAGVAKVGNTEYATLSDAFSQAPDGSTVTMTADITGLTTDGIATVPADKTLILNMDGHSITVANDFAGRPIVNDGTLTVTGNGIIDSSASEFGGYGAINNFGMLTIENGTFKGSVMADGSVVFVRPDSEAVINGGSFSGSTWVLFNQGKMTVNDGTFETMSCTQTIDSNGKSHWAYCVVSSGELYFNNGKVTGVQGALGINSGYAEVKGGTFSTIPCEHSNTGEYSHYALYIAGEEGEVEAHIYGGTYTSASKVAILCGNDNTNGDGGINAKATATIHGGTFVGGGDRTVMSAGKNTGDPKILGGTFSSDISVYMATGHVERIDTDTSYVVMPKSDLKPGTYKTATGEKIEAVNLAAESCPKTIAESGAGTYTIGAHKEATDKKNVRAATCTEEGYTGDTVCSACANVTTKGEAIPALGHKFSGAKCTVCGAIDPAYATINVIVQDEEGVSTSEQAAAKQAAAQTAASIVQAALGMEGASDPVEAGIVSEATYEELKKAVDAGTPIDVIIEAEPISPEAVPTADKKQIVSVIDGGTIAQYLDLSVMLMADGKKLGTIDKLDKPVKFTVAIPTDLIKDGRTFYVVRVHDGKAEKLPTTVEDGFATFETDRFSTYALAYEDTRAQAAEDAQASTSAQTGDATPIALFAGLGLAAIASIACIVVCLKRRARQR